MSSPKPTTSFTSLAELAPRDVAAVLRAFRTSLVTNQVALNNLNVYPVPDGDTGTNMMLTMTSVAEGIDQLASDSLASESLASDSLASESKANMGPLCQAISHQALMGARGNSGVILSQILRGFCGAIRDMDAVDGSALAAALTAASTAAYGAVMKPIEGTILTVARCAAEGAADAVGSGSSLLQVAEAARSQGAIGLAQTPELLPVLKAAGVVDSGGSGYMLLIDSLLHVIDGRDLPTLPLGEAAEGSVATIQNTPGDGSHKDVSELRYEVMYLLEAADASIPAFKDAWAAIGDSIVVVGGEGLFNCHIHTDAVGPAIEAGIDIGRPRNIRVTDLLDEVHALQEERWVREASGDAVVDEPPHVHEAVETAVVAVASGDGLRRLFWSLGVQQVVTGGQSMNPSTQQLLDAVEACPATSVLILPNNKNIIPVAEQVAPLTSKTVRVIPTKGVTEGLAAAMQYDPAGFADPNAATMRAAAAGVVAGEVTQAVRNSSCDVGPITAGDWLGIGRDDGIVTVESSLVDAVTGLLASLIDGQEILTIIEGEGSSAADTRAVTEWLADHHPDLAVETHHGGQPLYPYLFGLE
jgi:uncharacterized protein